MSTPKKNFFLIMFTCLILLTFFSTIVRSADIEKPAGPEPYRIAAGDILRITTWKEPDFTIDDIVVRIDGRITFPLLDDIMAAGRSTLELKNDIATRLAKYVENPFVTVTVKSPEGQKFYVLGEVVRTGEYKLVKNLTILQAFALAGGFTAWASKSEIILLRSENQKDVIIRIDYKNIVKGKDLSQNIQIKADDTIIVP
ncbi:MAG: polysaccharide biosynthesis/export family protein [Desulfobacterales bacterium]|nr:polysaccharide biosynthesis/export family protein [Desulfobacterales bacterium]